VRGVRRDFRFRGASFATKRAYAAKRGFDLVAALVLLIVLAPLIVVLGAAIKLDSPGPVLYRARRLGFKGREFAMLKFRKMREDASGAALTLAGDDRFTRIGRFLASTKLDELPQLWNVVRGQMSLVGPRPEDPEFVSLHPERYEQILRVKPGITGLCQLAFRAEGLILDASDPIGYYTERLLPQKVAIDELYAARRTLGMDLRILIWTAAALLGRVDIAVHRQTGRLSRRSPRLAVPEAAPVEAG
jgi:lipopolysaccharide/colanic/teichoic acid biosynthesis glycosyltransferase